MADVVCPDCASRPAWVSDATGWAKCAQCGLAWTALDRPNRGTTPMGAVGMLPPEWTVEATSRDVSYREGESEPTVRVELPAASQAWARWVFSRARGTTAIVRERHVVVSHGERVALDGRLRALVAIGQRGTPGGVIVLADGGRLDLVTTHDRATADALVRSIAVPLGLHLSERDDGALLARPKADVVKVQRAEGAPAEDTELRKRRMELRLGAAGLVLFSLLLVTVGLANVGEGHSGLLCFTALAWLPAMLGATYLWNAARTLDAPSASAPPPRMRVAEPAEGEERSEAENDASPTRPRSTKKIGGDVDLDGARLSSPRSARSPTEKEKTP